MRDPFEWADDDDDNAPILFANYCGEPNYPVPALAGRSNAKHEEDWPDDSIDLAPLKTFDTPQRAKPKTGTIVALIALGLLVSYCAVISEKPSNNRSASPVTPGWDELGSCSETISLDKNKSLTFTADGSATLTDFAAVQEDGSKKIAIGRGDWKYDAATKRLFVTVREIEVTYLLLSSDLLATCMLIKGDLSAADLMGSWFSTSDDDGSVYIEPNDH
jgi:hypothetical protein